MPTSKVDDQVDALFSLPLAEFTAARNTLAVQLKKNGRGDDAVLVKALAKPSISAWAVNQLYWNHREAFDRLIALGERFHKAQTSGKVADMRTVLDARREALTQLADLATSVLRKAGHNPAPDTIHRITTTLEGISAYASRSDGPRPGRLTHDVDPPGFESFGSFVASAVQRPRSAQPAVSKKKTPPAELVTTNARAEEARKSKIAAAKVSLRDAKKSLGDAQARVRSLEAAQKKAEENLKKAKAAAENAARRARSVTEEVEDAAGALEDAERRVEKAAEELKSLTRES